jgi:hypothetical protein
MVYKVDSIKMINFMLKTYGTQARCFEGNLLSFSIDALHKDFRAANHFRGNPWETQTPLFPDNLTVFFYDFRVRDSKERYMVSAMSSINRAIVPSTWATSSARVVRTSAG